MRKIGIVKFYNGKYGTIISENNIIDFENKDVSFNQSLQIGNTVEFREEIKPYNIRLARNINKISNN